MTFTEIVSSVSERLNLTSPDAVARIGRNVNDRYRRLTSSVGLQTSRRSQDTQSTVSANPRLTFALEKLEIVYVDVGGKIRVLDERTYDEWRQANTLLPQTGDPEWYAIETQGATTVGVVLWPTPGTTVLAVKADGLANASTLSGGMVPAFPVDFHDALVFGGIADEYDKMDKPAQAKRFEDKYENCAADLRYFLAKSAYLSTHQGPRARDVVIRPRGAWYK